MIPSRCLARVFILIAALSLPACTQQNQRDLTTLSLEDLMNIEVTSVSKKEQKLSHTPAAVFAITAEDIRRSGATKIPDLLRMVPGMDVASINANSWAVGARGLNGRLSNELLVLVDGRAVYTPTFGGVYWDVLDLPVQDIERIEVIRGPGGSIWGTNAVNGVVNIITKSAADTKGGMVVVGGGNAAENLGTIQYGHELGKSVDYRVYAQYSSHGQFAGLTTPKGADDWHLMREGFRLDSHVSPRDTLMFEGDIYRGQEGVPTVMLPSILSPLENVDARMDLSGGFLQSVWTRRYSDTSESSLLIDFNRYRRGLFFTEEHNSLDVEFQHHFAWKARHDIVLGGDYTYSNSKLRGGLSISMNPDIVNTHTIAGFVQDEIALVPRRLFLTLGSKLEQNHYTSLNLMPTARLTWVANKTHVLWGAVSHAVRTPGEDDVYMRFNFGGFPGPGGMPVLIAQIGNPHFNDERVDAFEVGFRTTAIKNLSLDIATFYNHYTSRPTMDPAPPFFEQTSLPHLVFPSTINNFMYGETHGIEVAANWKLSRRWMVSPGYAYQGIHMYVRPPSHDFTSVLAAEGSSPAHSAQLRSHFSLTAGWSWDAAAYFVDRLRDGPVPAYTRVDTGVTWRGNALTLSIFAQNLADSEHLEFQDITRVKSTLVGRGSYGQVTWNF